MEGKTMENYAQKFRVIKTLKWMIAHFDFMKQQTGLNDVDSPELAEAKELLMELTNEHREADR
jgi:hypothetical protein